MPPPIPTQQSSRAGLITTLVIFIILFLVSTVFWISTNQNLTKAEVALSEMQKRYRDVIPEGALASDATYTRALEDRKEYNVGTAFEVVRAQRDDLTQVIAGQVVPARDARKMAEGAIDAANTALPKGPDGRPVIQVTPGQPLTAAVSQLATAYAAVHSERAAAQQQLAAAQAAAAQADTTHQTQIQEKDAQIAAAQGEAQKARAEVEGYRAAQGQELTKLTESTSTQIKALSDAIAAGQVALSAKDAEAKKERAAKENALVQLKRYRLDPKENITRQADGKITRVTGDGYCFIDRGQGDHISVGMTFEVYDKLKGIPPVGDGLAEADDNRVRLAAATPPADGSGAASGLGAMAAARRNQAGPNLDLEMPKGKGSIEVVSVGPGNTSQCRIIRVDAGQTLAEGDIIGNLVYDGRRKMNFFVYGDFDMDGDGRPVAQDQAVIKRLAEQWGGRVIAITNPAKPADSLTLDADFVIMGKEPVLPNYTEEELADPQNKERYDKAVAAREQYESVRRKAIENGTPLMNQNRFLYYVGYNDQRRR